MKILLIAYHFPPDRAVGGLRAAKVAEAFRARGHMVEVITARLPDEELTFRPASAGLTVRTVKPWPGPREFWAWLRKSRTESQASAGTEPTDPAPEPAKPGWKRFLLSLIWLPDDRQGFILPALFAAVPRAWSADLIYSTAPPFSGHLTALLVKWLSWKKLVIEFRDPWTANTWKPANSRTRFSEAVERWLERRCVKAAHRIVSVSNGIHELMLRDHADRSKSKFLVARNGIEQLMPPRMAKESNGPTSIVYVGTFYFHRDPRPFLRALAKVRGRSPSGVSVSLVGQCRWFRGISIEREVESLGLSDIVVFRDWVDRDESNAIVENADLLLLLAQSQPAQIPNKLYEYLGTRAPILAFADEGGESARMLEMIGGHVVVTETEPVAVELKVARALELAGTPTSPGAEGTLEEWTTASQMGGLVRALEPEPAHKAPGMPAPSQSD